MEREPLFYFIFILFYFILLCSLPQPHAGGGSGARAPPGGRAGTALREPQPSVRRLRIGSRGKGLGMRREHEDPAPLGEGPKEQLASLIRQ